MWTDIFIQALAPFARWGVIGFFILFLLSSLLFYSFLNRARRARYYVLRERARRAGGRWLTVAFFSLVLALASFYLYLRGPPAANRPPVAAPPLTASVEGAVTPEAPSASPTPSPTASPLPSPTPSPTPSATPTPSYPLPETALTPRPEAVPASPQARIRLRTFALSEENGRPVQPGEVFPPGDHRIYLFIDYEGMSSGVVWTYGWYREGEYLDGNTCLWGIREETCPLVFGESGSTFLFFNPRSLESGAYPNGYVPGEYEVRIWIEDRFQGRLGFTIRE